MCHFQNAASSSVAAAPLLNPIIRKHCQTSVLSHRPCSAPCLLSGQHARQSPEHMSLTSIKNIPLVTSLVLQQHMVSEVPCRQYKASTAYGTWSTRSLEVAHVRRRRQNSQSGSTSCARRGQHAKQSTTRTRNTRRTLRRRV